jgi:hypothetical protein
VADEPRKSPGGGGESDDEGEDAGTDRPTVAPPFDPIAFAREVFGSDPPPPSKKPTPKGIPAAAGPAEAKTSPPHRRATPAGALSLADSQAPSLPPARKESTDAFTAVEREWEELATRPPPPMQQELIESMADSAAAASGKATVAPEARKPTESAPDIEIGEVISDVDLGDEEEDQEEEASSDTPAVDAVPSEQEMHDRVSLGDYTGALDIAEKLLLVDPNNAEANQCAEACRGVLKQMYTARIGALDRVPMVMVPRDQLRWLTIDHRAGFVLSLIDGVSSLEMILDVSGMPELDALRILSELVQQRIISFR